ncbi:hypothetical protein Tco_1177599 [Tanacetum coccineum]
MLLTGLFRQVMEWYPHLDNDIYDIVDQVIRPLALVQERKARKDREIKKGRHSTSSSPVFHHGSSSHQFDDDEEIQEEGTFRNSTPSPTTYFNSLSPIRPQVFQDPKLHEQNMPTLFSRQTSMLNRQEIIHVDHRGALKSLGRLSKERLQRKRSE